MKNVFCKMAKFLVVCRCLPSVSGIFRSLTCFGFDLRLQQIIATAPAVQKDTNA